VFEFLIRIAQTDQRRTGQRRLALLIFAIALCARLVYVLSASPYATPDSDTYLTVAGNIYQNFCVSRSDPAAALCTPSWAAIICPAIPW